MALNQIRTSLRVKGPSGRNHLFIGVHGEIVHRGVDRGKSPVGIHGLAHAIEELHFR